MNQLFGSQRYNRASSEAVDNVYTLPPLTNEDSSAGETPMGSQK